MNRLAQILPKENIRISLKATSKKRVFEQASLIFESRCNIARSKIFNSLFSREKLGSTGLGNGIAIPHGRLEGLKKSVAVVLSLDVPIPFDAIDGKAVDLLIFLLVPTSSSKDHLEILAEVANMLSDNKFIDELRCYTSTDQLYEGIFSWAKTDSKIAD
ncbi:MAG: PTS IIA-like nitrogen regulatory protein PtsN [Burkholderiaceae bacterium]